MTEPDLPLLVVDDLEVTYSRGWRNPPLKAVDGVSLRLAHGETLSVVGESGSGKSTLGSAILGTVRTSSGRIQFQGEDITGSSRSRRRRLGRHLQAVFQDPRSSLNPVRTVEQSLVEPLLTHGIATGAAAKEQVRAGLARVGLEADAAMRYPAQFSGGQRQRLAIARALMSDPSLIVCDEPVSSLDVSVQAQVLNVLLDVQRATSSSYLFISHNLTVVRHFSDRVLVMYRGRVMEQGAALQVCDDPRHPYTQALLAAVPVPDPATQRLRREARLRSIRTQAARVALVAAEQCPFVDRCPYQQERCHVERPALRPVGSGREVACHFAEDIPSAIDPFTQLPTRHVVGSD